MAFSVERATVLTIIVLSQAKGQIVGLAHINLLFRVHEDVNRIRQHKRRYGSSGRTRTCNPSVNSNTISNLRDCQDCDILLDLENLTGLS
jgi:hypothetical protein